MIRKVIIVLLALLAVVVGTAAIASRGQWVWRIPEWGVLYETWPHLHLEADRDALRIEFYFLHGDLSPDVEFPIHYQAINTFEGRPFWRKVGLTVMTCSRSLYYSVEDPRVTYGELSTEGVILKTRTWLLVVLFMVAATYPTIAFIRGPLRRRRRRKRGLCVSCGYDLTGNVTGVCSECGAEIRQP